MWSEGEKIRVRVGARRARRARRAKVENVWDQRLDTLGGMMCTESQGHRDSVHRVRVGRLHYTRVSRSARDAPITLFLTGLSVHGHREALHPIERPG